MSIAPGEYLLTITADVTCTGIPADLQTRTYPATLTGSALRPNWFSVAPFRFGLSVGASDVSIDIEYPVVIERLPSFTYLTFSGYAPTSAPATSTGRVVSIPFSGSVEYCVLKSEMGPWPANCHTVPHDQRIASSDCLSDSHHMILTPP